LALGSWLLALGSWLLALSVYEKVEVNGQNPFGVSHFLFVQIFFRYLNINPDDFSMGRDFPSRKPHTLFVRVYAFYDQLGGGVKAGSDVELVSSQLEEIHQGMALRLRAMNRWMI
jgi:hypothetical protein